MPKNWMQCLPLLRAKSYSARWEWCACRIQDVNSNLSKTEMMLCTTKPTLIPRPADKRR